MHRIVHLFNCCIIKTSYSQLKERFKDLKWWMRRITNKRDDDDSNQFNHPLAIF
ncbi:MAG TPA: hypothetical protein VGG71_00120 [Chitinophagaceae bacterium]|jgi:hypothetical protein